MYRHYFYLLFVAVLTLNANALTRQQMKNSLKILKKTCMSKNDVAEDLIGDIEKGKFIEEKSVMCYIACIYQMSQIVSAVVKRLQMLVCPPVLKSNNHGESIRDLSCCKASKTSVKNNKLNYEATIKQIDLMYPPELKKPVKIAVEKCKDVSSNYKDICEASFWSAKCIYEADPKNFVFA